MADDVRRQFRERIRSFILREIEQQGSSDVEVHRDEVEDIGASLGMNADQSCLAFFRSKGAVWAFAHGGSYATHLAPSDAGDPYPRDWLALTNVVLV